ncbi:MAG: AAA family ATPase, partial [Pseudonocardia sp.]|nr:AAA family ATPase [Pseudonocardia sp.]
PLTLKGKSRPVAAVRVGRLVPGVGGGAPGMQPPLLGRGDGLATLAEGFACARAGRGRVVEIVGDAGLGKTRLLAAFLDTIPGTPVFAARGAVYDAAVPYRSLRELLHTVLGVHAGASAVELTAAVDRVAPALAHWSPLIGLAAGIEVPETAEVAALDRRFRKARLETAVTELLVAAAPGPAVLVVEDLHLFDEASAEVVRRIAAAAPDRAWLVLSTRRPAGSTDPLTPQATRLELAPLDAVAATELLHTLTADAPLTPHVQDAVLVRAAGNPLFLCELVVGLREGVVDALPDSIEALIAARIDRLAPPDRSLLRAAAVLGMHVEPGLLGELLGADAPQRDGTEVAARLGGFVVLDGSGRLRFAQRLVRDTAYEGLAYSRRAMLHRRAADAISLRAGPQVDQVADLVAVHYAAARHWPATWHFARIAGRRARCAYAPAEAEAAYVLAAKAAEQLSPADGDLLEVFEALGDVRYDLGDGGGADTAYRAARGRAGDDAMALARLRLKTSRIRERSGRYSQALWWISRARTGIAAPELGVPAVALRARLDARSARIRHLQGRDTDAVVRAEAALAAARGCGDQRTVAAALEVLDWAEVALGRLDAPSHALHALAIHTELGDAGAGAHIRNGLGARAYFLGRWTEAADHYRRARTDFDRVGDVANAATASANLAEVLVDQNRLVEAEETLCAAMRIWQAVGAVSDTAWGRLQLGRIAARDGRAGDARAHFRFARAYFAAHHEATELLAVDAATAECDASAGRVEDALALADDALCRARSIAGLVAAVPALHRARGVALLHRHDRPGAAAALGESLAAARARQARHDVALALDVQLEHGLGGDEAAAWTRERDRLVDELGIRCLGG